MNDSFVFISDFLEGLGEEKLDERDKKDPGTGSMLLLSFIWYYFCVKKASQFYILDKRWQIHLISNDYSSVLLLLFLSAYYDNDEYFLLISSFGFHKALPS